MEPLEVGVFLVFGEDDLWKLEKAQGLGFKSAQIVRWPTGYFVGAERAAFKAALAKSGLALTTVFCAYEGESYASMEAVRDTIGLVPPTLRPQRVEETKKIADFAKELNAPRIAAHIGIIPADARDANYLGLVQDMRTICDYCVGLGLQFSLETGQETAEILRRFITDVARENLKVNFDPANMIAYGSGQPLEALSLLGELVVGFHCKDYRASKEAGRRFGEEARLGEGDVNIEAVITKLWEQGYRGPLTIEREIYGEQQWLDFAAAQKLLEGIRARLPKR